MKTHIWFESRLGGAAKTYSTEAEARSEIEQAKLGHPEKENMSEDDRNYWQGVANDMEVVKVTQTEEVLK